MAELVPITRKENFLARAAGNDGLVLEPITREEHFLQKIIDSGGGGGGGSITVDSKLSISSTNPVQNKVVTGAFMRAEDLVAAKADKMEFVDILSATPTITAQDNKFYICDGTQTSLTIPMIDAELSGTGQTLDPPSFIVRFNSGATQTKLTITNQIVMPDGFEVEANKTYEINVARWYALVSEWPYTAGGAA